MTMREQIDSFLNPDGLHIHTIRWQPEHDPYAVVILVHGIAEHTGRYRHVAEHLTAAGIAVYGMDFPGHGQSAGTRAYFKNYQDLVRDFGAFAEKVRRRHINLPRFIFAHSMGTVVALPHLLENQQQYAGAIIQATTIGIEDLYPEALLRVGDFSAKLLPRFRLIPLFPSAISRKPETVQTSKQDPLVDHGLGRLGVIMGIFRAGRAIRAQAHELTLPLLILHGEADRICPVSGSQFLYDTVASADKTLLTFPEMFHELHSEPEQETILRHYTDWIAERITKSTK